jgi:hypothetical protein
LWNRQALIDAGLKPGIKSVEVGEFAQARRTIEKLEAELAAVKAASALSNGRRPGPGLLRARACRFAGVSHRSSPRYRSSARYRPSRGADAAPDRRPAEPLLIPSDRFLNASPRPAQPLDYGE